MGCGQARGLKAARKLKDKRRIQRLIFTKIFNIV